MTQNYRQSNAAFGISRRTILRSMAAASTAGVLGVPVLSRSVSADHVAGHPTSKFDLYGIDHSTSPSTPRLIQLTEAVLTPGNTEKIVTYTNINLPSGTSSISLNTLAAHPFETDAFLYGTDLNSNRAFTVNPTTGDLTFFGSANPVLGGIAASAIIIDDADNARWYGITHNGASNPNQLWEIDLSDGSTTGGHQLNDGTDSIQATQVGMGVNFLTNELWGVIGDQNNSTDSQVFRIVDLATGELEIVNETALTGGRSVGAAFGPCANIMFVMRQGKTLYGYDVSDDAEFEYGTMVYSPGVPTDFDNLTVPYGSKCSECGPCELAEPVKFEYNEDLDTFVPEDWSGSSITFESYESKVGEEFEPMMATFALNFCPVYVLVKSGQEFEVQSFEEAADSITVETANDCEYAISFVEFYCDEADAINAMEDFPSKGRGRRE